MAYVVTQACIACRFGDCTQVCPTGAFHEGPNFVAINPATCANCGLCELACPVQAIRADWALTAEEREYLALNAELAAQWPVTTATEALAGAQAQALVPDKRALLVMPG
ncbi:ferredoxin family protein [Methylibium sp.]|uniref:ferredoxin family protein n=1 Tax=Methylibium sp. TaxID=2067992 RepID=UPI00180CBBA5|nr:ferredoxin family protein [Methylibium sp.]MBA3589093.1 ferredoxin family protein [Methylibium sp.]